MLRALVFVIAFVVLSSPSAALAAYVDLPLEFNHRGVLKSISDGPREQPIEGNLIVFQQGYTKTTTLWQLQEIKRTEEDGWQTIDGTLTTPDGKRLRVRQQFRADDASSTRVKLLVEAIDAVETDAVAYLVNVPNFRYSNGTCVVNGGDQLPVKLPVEFGQKQLRGVDGLKSVVLTSAMKRRESVTIEVDRSVFGFVQDNRAFKSETYGVGIQVHAGALKSGEVAEQSFTVRGSVGPASIHYDVSLMPFERDRTPFTGIGGNFVYGIDSDATRASLRSFTPHWVRVGVELAEWEPTNDNADSATWDEKLSAQRDAAGSKLRKRFELDRELFNRAPPGRFIASVWYLPEWLYAEPLPKGQWRDRAGTVPEERWPELIECVVSYLLHMKEQYGVEPALFSFNESDMGVYLKLNAAETHRLTILLGRAFEKANLQTKLLLGDSANPKDGIEQIGPTLADAKAMQYVGALGVHMWMASDGLDAWKRAARQAGVPILYTELGPNPEAWRDGSFAGERYWLRETDWLVGAIGWGTADGILQWEWSDDYSLWDKAGQPTARSRSTAWLNRTAIGTVERASVQWSHDKEVDWLIVELQACAVLTPRGFVWHLVNTGDACTVSIRDLKPSQYGGVSIEYAAGEKILELRDEKIAIPARSHVVLYPVERK